MAGRGVPEPGKLARRYEQLTGGPDRRRTYGQLREHLGFGRSEFDRLPWHDARMYVEYLAERTGQQTAEAADLAARSDGHHAPPDPVDPGLTAEQVDDPDAPAPPATEGAGATRPSWLSLPIRRAVVTSDDLGDDAVA